MTYPIVFASLAAGNQPLSDFDTMFNVAGQQGNIPCTVTGTNDLTATPYLDCYLPAIYTDAQIVSFKAVANSTGPCTFQIGGLAQVKLFTAAGVQADSGDLVVNNHYACEYWSDLDSGLGGFVILNATTTSIANPVVSFNNLAIIVISDSQLTLTADNLVMQNALGGTVRVSGVSLSMNIGASGANGLDTGSIAQGVYAVYAIYNPTSVTVAGLLSLSATSPTLPSGYTYFGRLGSVITDASPFLYRTLQNGDIAQFVLTPATNTANTIVMANGVAGTFSTTSPTLAALTVANVFVPATASRIKVLASTSWKAGTASNILVAPSVDWGGANNGPEGSAGNIYPVWITSTRPRSEAAWLSLESNDIAWSADAAGGAIGVLGWQDNL